MTKSNKLNIETVTLSDLGIGLVILDQVLDRVKTKTRRKRAEIEKSLTELEALNRRQGELEVLIQGLKKAISK